MRMILIIDNLIPSRHNRPLEIAKGFTMSQKLQLSDLKQGERARIVGMRIDNPAYRQRLLSMGLTRGTEIQLRRIAPLGDPVEVRVRGFSLSLRKHEAAGLRLVRVK